MKWARLTRDHRFLQMMRALYIPSLWFYVRKQLLFKGSGCGSVGGAVASDTRRLQFESSLFRLF